MKKRLLVLPLIFLIIFSITVQGDEEERYRLKNGEAYMDQTFVYTIEGQENGAEIQVLCAEMDAPTYDMKKGLITWIDYKAYSPEFIFGTDAGGHIRAILELAGPHLNQESVVEELKELTGISELTYDEVVSAMQYAIWFYSDEDFRIPTSNNGEDLYRYLVTLPPVDGEETKDMPNVSDLIYTYDEESNQIVIQFHYWGPDGSKLNHTYSKNIVTNYNGRESVSIDNGVYYVTLKIPRVTMSMDIDFEVKVSGQVASEEGAIVFAPDKEGSVQMLVGIGNPKQMYTMRTKTKKIKYRTYRLILNDGQDQTITSHKADTMVSLMEINTINPTGRNGYRFDGWQDESNLIVFEGVLMDRDRVLNALYTKIKKDEDLPDEQLPENPPNGGDDEPDDEGPKPDGGNPDDEGSEPDNSNPDDKEPKPDRDYPDDSDNKPDDENLDINDEKLPENDNPGWMPSTGGIPLLIFVTSGSIALIIGIYLRKKA